MLRNYNNKFGYYCNKLFFRRYNREPCCGYYLFPRDPRNGNPYWSFTAADAQGIKCFKSISVYLERKSSTYKNVTEGVIIFVKPKNYDFGRNNPDFIIDINTPINVIQQTFQAEERGFGSFGLPVRYILISDIFQRDTDDSSHVKVDWSGNLKLHEGEEICILIFNVNMIGSIGPPNNLNALKIYPSCDNVSYNGILQFKVTY